MSTKRKTTVNITDSEDDMPKKPAPSKKSFNYKDYLQRTGPENLGELDNIGRDSAVEAAKRYGAKVTAAPSGRTSYVILGREPGPKKLQIIKEKGLKTLDENGFCQLIANSNGDLDSNSLSKLKKEEEKIKKDAKELERIEQDKSSQLKSTSKASSISPNSQLWTVKYSPNQLKDICGNKGQVEKIVNWLKDWQNHLRNGFPSDNSKSDIKGKKALLVHGAPGIGKTTAAHLAAKSAGYSPLELNASDVRSKKLIESTTNIDNTSIDTFFGNNNNDAINTNVTHSTCLIFDECDAKADYYFHDHSLIPLFVQENYVKCNPVKARDSDHNRSEFNRIKCLSDAADAISDGDLVDSMIHGSQQQWSLMPIHAIHSTVRPASFMYGGFKSGYGRDTISFPAWLGQYSKTNKYNRALGDIQARMRLKISGEANEIRQYYYPTLWPSLYKPLIETNPDYEKVIGLLDEYFLSKDEFDIMSELGLDRLSIDNTMKLIPTKNKSAFTRHYNNRDHPIPFSKGQVVKASAAQIKTEKPDHEDVYDDDDVVVDLKEDDENENEDGDDVLDDKLIKQPKKSSAAKTSTRGRTTTTSKRGRGRGSTTKK
ncbi:DNA replication factor C, large subunit [Wallemia mellicola]|nr:DNA replication factor C, large subunit [Wallemia mellicola]TIB98391.1 DNA replication factor C, large subunit [Wallemia mellicola]